MICISWVCRGLGNPEAVRELRSVANQEGPALVFVMETKIKGKKVENLQRTLGFAGSFGVDSEGLSGGIGLFWSRDVIVSLKNYNSSHIDITVRELIFLNRSGGLQVFMEHHELRTDTTVGVPKNSA